MGYMSYVGIYGYNGLYELCGYIWVIWSYGLQLYMSYVGIWVIWSYGLYELCGYIWVIICVKWVMWVTCVI